MNRRLLFTLLLMSAFLAWCVAPVLAARFPSKIDLTNPFNARTLRVLGASANESSGSSLASGNFNGDGYEDIVIGSHTALNGRGITYVVFGSANSSSKDSLDLSVNATGILRILGKSVLDWSGYAVAAGNLNGDAYTDIIIGSYRADPGGRVNAGEVYVIFGSSTLATRGTIDLSNVPSDVLQIRGNLTEDGFGYSLASGRVNGDTYDDLIVGAFHADPEGRENAGQAYIIYGSAALQSKGIIDISASPSGVTKIYGETARDMEGTSVAAGNLNGDAYTDVIIGGTGALGGKGCVYAVPGSSGISSRTAIDLSSLSEELVKIYGVSENEGWGSSLRTGNLNGDGYSDLIMGAPLRDSYYRNDSGEIAVFFGEAAFWDKGTVYLSPDPTYNTIRIRGADSGEQAGTALAAGDVNHDGRDELFIGAPYASPEGRIESGAVYVLSGAANLQLKGTVDLADTSQAISCMEGVISGGHAGAAVCSTNLNGDVFKDVVIGNPFGNPAGKSGAGETYAVFGFGAPAILSYRPLDTKAATPNSNISVNFNSDMSSIIMQVYDDQSIKAPDSLSTSGSSFVYQPVHKFIPGSQIRVTVNGIDRDGQSLQYIWYFDVKTDEIPPRFLSTAPFNGETLVSPKQNIVVKFNGDIKPDSTRITIKGVNDRVISMSKSWTDSTLTLVNSNSFRMNEKITVTISAGDQYSDRADSTWSFTTRPETTPPTCTVQVPGIPQLLPKNSWFRLIFPFDVDKSTVEAVLSGNLTGDISGTWVWADSIYTFTPAKDLRPSETLLLTVNAKDIYKNELTGWTATFKVKADEIPPSVDSHSPESSETNVSVSSPIVIVFSSDVCRDSTSVVVTSKTQGTLSMVSTWLDYTLTLKRSTTFALNDSIKVKVKTGDIYANRAEYSWGFTTRPESTPPTYSIISPVQRNFIAATDSITLSFSTDVDTTKVSVSLKGRLNESIPGKWRWSGTRYTFTPTTPYQAGNILTLTVNAADIYGNVSPESTVTFTVKPESVPPVILSHVPAPYADSVSVSSAITIRFNSDAVSDSTTVTLRSNQRKSISYTRSWTDSTLTITPSSSFQKNEAVTVSVSAADRYGNRMIYAWTFYTGSVIPLYTVAVVTDPTLMLPGTPLSVNVSKIVDSTTLAAFLTGSLSGGISGSWAWADTVCTFTPSTGYRMGETLTLRIQATDIYGNTIPVFTRELRIRADISAPVIRSQSPLSGEANVDPSGNIVIAFSGDAAHDSTTALVRGAQNRAITVTSSWQDSTLTLRHSESFRLGETITVTIKTGDIYSNRAEYSWNFTVRPEITPPTFRVATSHDTQLLLTHDTITLVFPGDVNTASVSTVLTGSLSGTVSGSWAWSDSLYTFTPKGYRPGETLTLTVNASDIHKNAIPETVRTFRVRTDEVPPFIRSQSPLSGEANVDPAGNIIIAFSGDAVHDSTTIKVLNTKNQAITVTSSWQDSTLTLRHSESFRLGDTVTVTVKTGDIYSNRAEYSWSFTVRPEITPPTYRVVTSHDSQLLLSSDSITLVFPGDIDPAAVRVTLTGSLSGTVSGSWTWSDSLYTFTPTGYRPGETLTLTVNASDIHKNAIPETVQTFVVKMDDIPPVIHSRIPDVYAAQVPVTQAIVVRFSADAVPDSTKISLRSDKRTSIPYAKSWADSTLTITPSSQLQQNETVTISLNATDRYGNHMVNSWTFFTGSAVFPYTPVVKTDRNMLFPETPITIYFGKNANRSTVYASVTGSLSGAVAGTWAWADSIYTFTPSPGYRLGETLTLIINAQDTTGNTIPEFTQTFQVRADISAPSILSRTPSPDAVNEHPGQDIVIAFSGDAAHDSTTVQVRGSQNRAITMTSSWQDSTLTLHHADSFRLGETITVTVNTGDIYSNRAEYSWSFTVRPEITPPTFKTVTAHDSQLLLPNDPITLLFPGDVDPATVHATLTGSQSGTVSGSWAWSDSLYTFTPAEYRSGETLRLTVNAADIHLNAIPETVITFRVRGDAVQPAVVSTLPLSGEKNVNPKSSIVITFTGDAIPDSTKVLVKNSKNSVIPCTSSWIDSTITLKSSASLPLGETITVTVQTSDLDANHAEYSWSFSTRPDINPPTVQIEAQGDSTALAANALLILIFSADVDTTQVTANLTGSLSDSIAGVWSWNGSQCTFTPKGLYRLGETITLRVTASDIYGNTLPETVRTYTVGEHTPRLSITGVELADSTALSYRVRYTFDDPDGNYTVTRNWQYSLDNGSWMSIPESDISGNTSRAPGTYQIFWKIPSAFTGIYSQKLRFRMEVFDGRYGSGKQVSPYFGVDRNQPPEVAVRNMETDYIHGKLIVGFKISDAESNPVSLRFEYSLDGGLTWKAGTPDKALENIPSSGYSGSFGWSYLEILQKGMDYYGVRVRLRPSDYKSGAFTVSNPFRLDLNDPPSVTLDDIFTPQTGDVPISFHITDAENDTVRFVCFYSSDNGTTWIPTSHVSSTENITVSNGTLVWHSGRDLPAIQSWNVRFKAIPYDHDEGTGASTGSFQLLNDAPPLISVAFPDTSGYMIRLPIKITDGERDPVTLHVSWSANDGTTWSPATILSDTLNLSSNAVTDTLKWMARTDLGEGFFERVHLRVMAEDAYNPPDSTNQGYAGGVLSIDNLPPRLVSAHGVAGHDTVYVLFDEPLEGQSALVPGNYNLSEVLHVAGVKKGTSRERFILILEKGQILPFQEITLQTINLVDRFGNAAGMLTDTFLPDDGNANPTVRIEDLPATVSGDVTVSFHIQDAESDSVSLSVYYSSNGGVSWTPASVSGALSFLGQGQYDGMFLWRSGTDLQGKDITKVQLRVTPRDSQEGEPALSNTFQVENNLAPSVALSVTNPDSIHSGAIDISYTLTDAESDTLELAVSYSTDSGKTFLPATVTGTLSGISGDRYTETLHWNTADDLPDFFGQALVRAEPRDARTGSPDTLAVIIDNYGSCRASLTVPEGESTGDIKVQYTITDPHSRAVSLRVNYSIDNGITWKTAAVTEKLDAIEKDRYTGSFTWRSTSDLAGYEGPTLVEVVPNNGRDGVSGKGRVTVDYNTPPVTMITPITVEISGDAAISFAVNDAERDTVSIILRYSIDNRNTWYNAEISGEVSGIPSDGEERIITWRSGIDLPGKDLDAVWLRLAAADADTGAFAELGPVHLDNNQPPTVQLSLAAPLSPYAETAELHYELADAERNMLHIEMLYSTDKGTTYSPATVTGKTSSIFSSGYSGMVVWNLAADLPGRTGEAIVKCIPWDTDSGVPDSLTVSFNTIGEFRVTLTAPDGVQNSDIPLSYMLYDQKNRTMSLHPEYSISGSEWETATVTGKTDGIGSDTYSGTLIWKGKTDLPGFTGTVFFPGDTGHRCHGRTGHGTSKCELQRTADGQRSPERHGGHIQRRLESFFYRA